VKHKIGCVRSLVKNVAKSLSGKATYQDK